MANKDLTFDNIIASGSGSFKRESGFSASVRRMQTKLNRLGYYCGTADGIFGPNTEKQVKAFQADNDLTADGYAGAKTLSKLDALSPDTATENYGRELTHSQLTGGESTMSETEALARCIYGEDTTHADGQAAVAKEIYNRKKTSRNFGTKTWKGIVFASNQYTVMIGGSSSTEFSRKPDQYSTAWANCVSLAETLVSGSIPNSALAHQCYHKSSNSSYPSDAVESTKIQIPAGTGNKFYDTQTTL